MAGRDAVDWGDRDTQILQILGSLLTEQHREEQALLVLEAALEMEPGNADVRKAIAAVQILLRKNEEALTNAETAIKQVSSPDDAAALQLVRSRALWGLGRKDAARAAMAEFLKSRTTS